MTDRKGEEIEKDERDEDVQEDAGCRVLGKEKEGSTKKKWVGDVRENVRNKGVENWSTNLLNRRGWKKVTKLWVKIVSKSFISIFPLYNNKA